MANQFAYKLLSIGHEPVSRHSITWSVMPFTLFCWLALLVLPLHAAEGSRLIVEPNVETSQMGGVKVPSADVLKKMHASQYILHASRGNLTKVPVSRVLLPHSNDMNPQAVQVDVGPKGEIYVRQSEVLCKSNDGGRTWTSRPVRLPPDEGLSFRWKVLGDGTFISVGCTMGKVTDEPATVWASNDDGATWKKRAEFALDDMPLAGGKPYVERYASFGLTRLRDDTLIWGIDVRNPSKVGGVLYQFQSSDGGHIWEGPTVVCDRGASEGATVRLPSGRLFATIRIGNAVVRPSDPPLLMKFTKKTNEPPFNGRNRVKNLFLTDSDDNGKTWSPARLLTTVFGQPFGYPAVQSDGTVVVIHDTRYGPGPPGSRALISRNEGKNWLDEVYYLDSTKFTGSYTASVVLEDDTILTIAGSSQAPGSWEAVKNKTDLYAIRWKPVKKNK